MAYPRLRSMNASLNEGATDGRYKKIRPDTECADTDDKVQNLTYDTRESLSLPYYGVGMAREMRVPARLETVTTPDFYKNKLERLEDSGVLGQTW